MVLHSRLLTCIRGRKKGVVNILVVMQSTQTGNTPLNTASHSCNLTQTEIHARYLAYHHLYTSSRYIKPYIFSSRRTQRVEGGGGRRLNFQLMLPYFTLCPFTITFRVCYLLNMESHLSALFKPPGGNLLCSLFPVFQLCLVMNILNFLHNKLLI